MDCAAAPVAAQQPRAMAMKANGRIKRFSQPAFDLRFSLQFHDYAKPQTEKSSGKANVAAKTNAVWRR
jgi:hypothetical protein